MKRKGTRGVAIVMAFLLAVPPCVAQAGEPVVEIDETAYISMNYYGQRKDVSVVKGCNLNGLRNFTDYGDYKNVSNMSNRAIPEVSKGGVKWNLSEEILGKKPSERFYYECVLDEKAPLVLPWDFDISYKLNGVSKKAEELAGAEGLVEINVHAIPNKTASDYYRNNMLLQVGMMVNMEDVLSIDAPGAQLQSVGTYKAVVFMGLPGEDITFTIRVGTESYEDEGLTMMMIPGTLSQLADIKELKENKDKIEDAGKAIKSAMDDILTTMETMSSGLAQTRAGLENLDEGREEISSTKEDIYANSDQAITDLTNMTDYFQKVVPQLKTSQSFITSLNRQGNQAVKTLTGMKTHLREYDTTISDIQEEVREIQDLLEKGDDMQGRRKSATNKLKNSISDLNSSISDLQGDSSTLKSSMKDLSGSSDSLHKALGKLVQNKKFADFITADVAGTLGQGATKEELQQLLTEIFGTAQAGTGLVGDTTKVTDNTSQIIGSLNDTLGNGQDLLYATRSLVDVMDQYMALADDGYDNVQGLLKLTNKMGSITQDVLKTSEDLIDDVADTQEIFNSYEKDALELIDTMSETTQQMNEVLMSTLMFLTSVQATMRRSGVSIDKGTEKVLAGMIDVIEKALTGISKTSTVKNANQLIYDAIDREMQRFEEETNVLYMDGTAKPVSFTSDKNPAPTTLQVLLRTEEISLDKLEENMDMEGQKKKESIWQRIKKIFVKMYRGVTSAFSE